MPRLATTLLSAAIASAALPAHAQWLYHDSLYADPGNLPAGTSGVHFGKTIAIDRNADGSIRALYVGLPHADVTDYQGNVHPAAGKVEVWVPQGGWHHVDTLTNGAYVQANAHFGAALAAYRGAILVGAPDHDFNTWVDTGIVTLMFDDAAGLPGSAPPDIRIALWWPGTETNGKRGWSVALDGDGVTAGGDDAWLAFGSPYRNGAGCVTVGHLANGGDSDLLSEVCGPNGSNLGSSLALRHIDSTHFVLAAGAPAAQLGDQQLAGQVHVYLAPTSGSQTPLLLQTLTADSPAFLDAFGSSVAMDGSRIHVGGTGRQKSGVGRTGSVSIFKPNGIIGYSRETEVFGSAAGDLCGASLAADTRHGAAPFVTGCPGHDDLVANAGGVRFVRRVFTGVWLWTSTTIDMADLPHGADELGRSVAMGDGLVYAGAPGNDDVGNNNGAVRIFAPDLIFKDGFD